MYDYNDETTARRGHGDFVLGVLTGAALGAAAALLYAPVRGRDAREMIGERVQKGVERANAAIDRGRELAAKGSDLASQGRSFVDDARETVTQAVKDGREAYRRVKQHA
jgi:gas vesicle protein